MIPTALDRTIRLCRYLIPDASDEAIAGALMSTTVALVVDSANASSLACQNAIVTLSMLAMQMGCSVHIVGPDPVLILPQRPWRGATLSAVLADMAGNTVPAVAFAFKGHPGPEDVVFAFGDTATDVRHGWRVCATPWTGRIQPLELGGALWRADFPVGGLAAATLAATEAFKTAMRKLDPKGPRADELRAAREATVCLGDDSASVPPSLGRTDWISGGAIVQAALYVLLRVNSLEGQARVIEPQDLDVTNCNRYALSPRSQVGYAKVEILAGCSSSDLVITGVKTLFDETTVTGLAPLAPVVVVGTDNVPSRWTAQDADPRWLVIGATSEFMAMVSEHDGTGGCAGCVHGYDDGVRATIPTISFVSFWAGLLVAARILHHAAGRAWGHSGDVTLLFALRQDAARATLHYPNARRASCPLCARRAA